MMQLSRASLRAALAISAILALPFRHEQVLFQAIPRRDASYRRPHRRMTGRSYAPNGARERARRVAQIASGRLTVANGLVSLQAAA